MTVLSGRKAELAEIVESIYKQLEEGCPDSWDLRGVLADVYAEMGEEELERGQRWQIEHQIRPLQHFGRCWWGPLHGKTLGEVFPQVSAMYGLPEYQPENMRNAELRLSIGLTKFIERNGRLPWPGTSSYNWDS